jgi:hypothetical protein
MLKAVDHGCVQKILQNIIEHMSNHLTVFLNMTDGIYVRTLKGIAAWNGFLAYPVTSDM